MRTSLLLLATLLYLTTPVLSINITSPSSSSNTTLDPTTSGSPLTWTSVKTDPSRARVVLVNMAGPTPISKDLGEVDVAKGKAVLYLKGDEAKGVKDGEGWRVNFLSLGNNGDGGQQAEGAILAQSGVFAVKVVVVVEKATGTGSVTGSVTGTATGTGSSTGTAAATKTSSGGAGGVVAPTGVRGGEMLMVLAGVAAVLV